MKLIRYEYPQKLGMSAFNRLFDMGVPALERFGGLFDDFMDPEAGLHYPAADLYEDNQNFYALLELPGVPRDSIDLELENAVLTVSSSQTEETEAMKSAYRYQRSITVPDGVTLDQVSASYEDGILTVTMPKEAGRQARQITVK